MSDDVTNIPIGHALSTFFKIEYYASMPNESTNVDATGRRGPAEHSIREQIVDAANEHFKHYGYHKTTVADLAKAIGFSKAYIIRLLYLDNRICHSSHAGLAPNIYCEE